MEIMRNVRKWGNSSGVLLPREWAGKEAKIVLVDRSLEVKKEIFDILTEYLDDILGIYLVGSYSRGEEREESGIDLVVISNKTTCELSSGQYRISIQTMEGIRKIIQSRPEMILPRLYEAKAILNGVLLEELNSAKVNKRSFGEFVKDCKRLIAENKGLLKKDRTRKRKSVSNLKTIYSLVSSLRGVFLINLLLAKEEYSKKEFLRWLEKDGGLSADAVYDIYSKIKDGNKVSAEFSVDVAERLVDKLEEEVNAIGK
jgi:predicted nucleotidyltransferase